MERFLGDSDDGPGANGDEAARLLSGDSLRGPDGVCRLLHLAQHPVWAALRGSARSLPAPGAADGTPTGWIQRAVAWMEDLQQTYMQSLVSGHPGISLLTAEQFVREGKGTLLGIPDQLKQRLIQQGVLINVSTDEEFTVTGLNVASMRSLGAILICWCSCLLQSLKKDFERTKKWIVDFTHVSERVSKAYNEFNAKQLSPYDPICIAEYLRLGDMVDDLLTRLENLVVVPERAALLSCTKLAQSIQGYLSLHATPETRQRHTEACYLAPHRVTQQRFGLLDSLVHRAALSSESEPSVPGMDVRGTLRSLLARAFQNVLQRMELELSPITAAFCSVKAWEVESELYSVHPANGSEDAEFEQYRDQGRLLKRALEDSSQMLLSTQVLTETIEAKAFVRMTSEQLAPPKIRQDRAEAEALARQRLDLTDGLKAISTDTPRRPSQMNNNTDEKDVNEGEGKGGNVDDDSDTEEEEEEEEEEDDDEDADEDNDEQEHENERELMQEVEVVEDMADEVMKDENDDENINSEPSLGGSEITNCEPDQEAIPPIPQSDELRDTSQLTGVNGSRDKAPNVSDLQSESSLQASSANGTAGNGKSHELPHHLLRASNGTCRFQFEVARQAYRFMACFLVETNHNYVASGRIPAQLCEKARVRVDEFCTFLDAKLGDGRIYAASVMRILLKSDSDQNEYSKFCQSYKDSGHVPMFALSETARLYLITPTFQEHAKKYVSFESLTSPYAVVLDKVDPDRSTSQEIESGSLISPKEDVVLHSPSRTEPREKWNIPSAADNSSPPVSPPHTKTIKLVQSMKKATYRAPPPPPSLAYESLGGGTEAVSTVPAPMENVVMAQDGSHRFQWEVARQSRRFATSMVVEMDPSDLAHGWIPTQLHEKARVRLEEFQKFLDSKLTSGRNQVLVLRLAFDSDVDEQEYKKFCKIYEEKERIALFSLNDWTKLYLVTPKFQKAAKKHVSFKKYTCPYAVVVTKQNVLL